MKTAQGSISVDVSKFVAGIELATAKLLTLREALERSSAVARSGFRIYDAVQAVASKLNSIKEQWKNIADAISFVKNVSQNVPKIFDSIRSTAQGALNAIKNMPPLFQKLAVTVAAAGIAFYALKKGMDAINSIGKSVASAIGSIAGKVTSLAKAGISGVGGILSGAFEVLGSVAKTAGISIGGVGLALGALDRFFKIGITSAIELGDEYNTLSKRTGASVGFLYDLGKVLKNNGSSSSYAATAISHMQRALTGVNELGQPTADIFKRLNLSTEELQNDAPEKAIVKLSRAILNLKSPAEQTRAATELFGKAGSSMLAVFKDESFAKLSSGISSTGQTLQKNAENFSKIATQLRDSGSAFRGFFIEMAGAVAPEILELFKMLQGGDALSGFGARLGAQIKFGADALIGAFKTGMIFDMLKLSFETASIVLKDLMTRTFQFASTLLAKLLEADVSTAILSGIGSALIGSFSIISGTILKALATPLAFFSAGIQTAFEKSIEFLVQQFPKLASFLKIGGFKAGSFGENMAERRGAIAGFADETIKAGFENVASGIQEAIKGVTDGFAVFKDEIAKFPTASKEAKDAVAKFSGTLSALAVAGKPTEKAISDVTGQAELGAKGGKLSNAMKETAVSSLQRIGGGGGAFGGDPLLKVSEDQLSESKQQTKLLNQIYTSFSGVGYSPAYQSGEFATFR